jgi:hypothetical protein
VLGRLNPQARWPTQLRNWFVLGPSALAQVLTGKWEVEQASSGDRREDAARLPCACNLQKPAARPHEFLGGILTRFYTEMAQLRALLAPAIVGAQDAEPTSTELAQHELLKDSTAEAQKRKMEGGKKKEPPGYLAAAFGLPVWIFMSAVTAFSQCNYFALLLWPCLREKWFQRVTEEAHRHSAAPTNLPAHQENTAHHMHFGSRSSSTTT